MKNAKIHSKVENLSEIDNSKEENGTFPKLGKGEVTSFPKITMHGKS